jgi:transcriptional regulator with XRE-family HTH domain
MQSWLQQFLDKKHLTPAHFAEVIGVQRSGITHILNGRNKPSMDFIRKMLTSYPDLNSEWLITGKGEMFKKETTSTGISKPATVNDTEQQNLFDNEPKKGQEQKNNTINNNEKIETHIEKDDNNFVERIVIFNKSGTFKEYLPEK